MRAKEVKPLSVQTTAPIGVVSENATRGQHDRENAKPLSP
jgi:hypothetical protein